MSESESTNILIVDNHSIDLQIVRNLFDQKQVNLLWINSDEVAVFMEKSSLVDLIFIAVSMLGENEFMLCQQLQSSGLNIPIILITTEKQATIKTWLSLGVMDYLFTCLDTEEFLLKLNNYWKLAEYRKEVRQNLNQLKQELKTERRENLQLKNINYQLEIKVESNQKELQKSITESENKKTRRRQQQSIYVEISQV